MKQSNIKRALTFVKEIFTKNIYLKLFYLALIIFLCYAPTFCNHTKITTPSKDAYMLYEMAQGVETEEELRSFEHKYHEMELAYRQRYNGATAIKFRLMTQSIAEEAWARRDAFRQMEDAEFNAEQQLQTILDDMDAAWQIEITSKQKAYATYCEILDDLVATHMSMRAKLLESGLYYIEVAAADYPEDMLDKHAAIKAEAEDLMSKLAEYRDEARHFNLAYRLKFNESFPNSMLLERYVAAFDGKYARISKGVEYGDAEYIIELLDLADSYEDIDSVIAVKDAIYDAYMAEGESGQGDAYLFESDLEQPIDDARARIGQETSFEQTQADFSAIVADKDAIWNNFREKEREAAANMDYSDYENMFGDVEIDFSEYDF